MTARCILGFRAPCADAASLSIRCRTVVRLDYLGCWILYALKFAGGVSHTAAT
jgi:hypothetical protein